MTLRRFEDIRTRLIDLLADPAMSLTDAALEIARLEYPQLDPAPTRETLARFGDLAAARVKPLADQPPRERVRAVNDVIYDEAGFEGDRETYDDIRNSCLNAVVTRRRGIPITLAIVYIDIATRAGLDVRGVSFPGHFLVRCSGEGHHDDLILDPFTGGVELSEVDLRRILMTHMGDDAVFEPGLVTPASPRATVERMLTNIKRLYVRQQAFADARRVTDMLLAINPADMDERRDRGLLSFHLGDMHGALRDLEAYLKDRRFIAPSDDAEIDDTMEPVWAHVKTLRRRIASFN